MKKVLVAADVGLAVGLAFVPLGRAAPKAASPEELRETRARFRATEDLMQAQRWNEALAMLEYVALVKETPTVRYYRAVCESKLGRLLAARRDFEHARALAEADKTLRTDEQQTLNDEVQKGIDDLERRLATLVLEGVDEPGLEVTIDGERVPPNELAGAVLRLDPGEHALAAVALSMPRLEQTIRLAEHQRLRFRLRPEQPASVPLAAGPVAPAASAAPSAAVPAAAPRVGAWAVGGGSLALAGLAAGYFVAYRGTVNDRRATCSSTSFYCDRDAWETAVATNRDIAFTAGAAALVTAGISVWLFVSPQSPTAPAVGFSPSGVSVVRAFLPATAVRVVPGGKGTHAPRSQRGVLAGQDSLLDERASSEQSARVVASSQPSGLEGTQPHTPRNESHGVRALQRTPPVAQCPSAVHGRSTLRAVYFR